MGISCRPAGSSWLDCFNQVCPLHTMSNLSSLIDYFHSPSSVHSPFLQDLTKILAWYLSLARVWSMCLFPGDRLGKGPSRAQMIFQAWDERNTRMHTRPNRAATSWVLHGETRALVLLIRCRDICLLARTVQMPPHYSSVFKGCTQKGTELGVWERCEQFGLLYIHNYKPKPEVWVHICNILSHSVGSGAVCCREKLEVASNYSRWIFPC